MQTKSSKIRIPKALHELHGEYANPFDLWVNYLTGFLATAAIVYLANDWQFSLLKLIVLAILALDLSGGVVSNFTTATSQYYAKSKNLRYLFLTIHLVQPAVLTWIYPEYIYEIVIVSGYTLVCTLIVNELAHYEKQRTIASFLMVMGIILTITMGISEAALLIMMLLFVIKLLLAFAVKWE